MILIREDDGQFQQLLGVDRVSVRQQGSLAKERVTDREFVAYNYLNDGVSLDVSMMLGTDYLGAAQDPEYPLTVEFFLENCRLNSTILAVDYAGQLYSNMVVSNWTKEQAGTDTWAVFIQLEDFRVADSLSVDVLVGPRRVPRGDVSAALAPKESTGTGGTTPDALGNQNGGNAFIDAFNAGFGAFGGE